MAAVMPTQQGAGQCMARVAAEGDGVIYNKLLAVLNQLVELDTHMLFVEPVQESFAPNYFSVISRPMDFCTMYTKVLDSEYEGWDDFVADFELMCANARVYNARHSKVYGIASRMHEKGLRLIRSARQPPMQAKRTLLLTHAECQNHITPAGFGERYIKDMKKEAEVEVEGETGVAGRGSCRGGRSGGAGQARNANGVDVPPTPRSTPTSPWVPEQPNRVLEVWAALSGMQLRVNGVAVLCAQQLTTSPTMNEALDCHIEASAAEDPFAEACLQENALEALPQRGLSTTSGRSFSGRPAMPLLSRSATQRESHTDDVGPLSTRGGNHARPAFAEAAAAAVAKAAAEEAGSPPAKKARRQVSPDWGVDQDSDSPGHGMQRSNSSAFMLDWVQPAVQHVHTAAYLERIAKEIERLRKEQSSDGGGVKNGGKGRHLFRCVSLTQKGDTFISRRSLHAALCASYTVCRAVDQVMAAQFRNAFCVIRPPGHHAGPSGSTRVDVGADGRRGELVGQGFCLINHVAVGARYALQNHSLRRVAVIDWDLHHGNGTEACCLQSSRDAGGMPDMLYCSIHGASTDETERPLFPGTARKAEVDLQRGLVNIPVGHGTRPQQYMDLFQNVLCKAVREYGPDLIVISAGFDGHKDDMFGFLRLSDNTYKKLTECVMDLADQVCHGRVVSVLEGGYTVQTLAQCCEMHVKTLATHNQPTSVKEARRQQRGHKGVSGLDRLRRLRSVDSVHSSRSSGGTSNTPQPLPLHCPAPDNPSGGRDEEEVTCGTTTSRSAAEDSRREDMMTPDQPLVVDTRVASATSPFASFAIEVSGSGGAESSSLNLIPSSGDERPDEAAKAADSSPDVTIDRRSELKVKLTLPPPT